MKPPRRTSTYLLYTFVAGITLVLATMVVFDREAGLLRLHDMQLHHDELTSESRELEQLRDHLAIRLDLVEDQDPAMLEVAARDKNMIHPGDRVYRIRYDVPATATSR